VFTEPLALRRVTQQYAGVTHDTAPRIGSAADIPQVVRPHHDPRDPQLRLDAFFDPGPRLVLYPDPDPQGPPIGDPPGAVAGAGTVDGVPVVAFASDPRVSGGALGVSACAVILEAYRAARERDCPVVGIWHSGGARLDEGVRSLHAVGQVFEAMTSASGVLPQISVVVGAAAGGAAYGPALTDIVVQAPEGRIFVTGPDVVRWATGEDVSAEDLGGADAHAVHSGVTHITVDDEAHALATARRLCSLLADQGSLDLAVVEAADVDLGQFIPQRRNVVYDVRVLVNGLLDEPGLELQPRWAPNVVTALGRLGGRSVGVIANNPAHMVGCLDSASAEKASRFVRLCDSFGVPIVVLVDVPGYLPGRGEELGGIVRRGAKLLHAFAETVVPTVTVVTRKAYGGAYIAMNARSLGSGTTLAWPGAQIAVMSPVSAVRLLHRRSLASVSGDLQRAVLEQVLADEHAATVDGLDTAVELGIIDEVVEPRDTRHRIAQAIAGSLAEQESRGGPIRGKHGNIPL
jgi:acetyl-CoA/propionyl-CoA carboxylase carboxyl transferase subunit